MNKVLHYFIKNSFLVNLLTVFVLVVGFISLKSMKRDLIPPFEFKTVNVWVGLAGASSEEIEKYISFPIEEAIKGLPGIDRVTSESKNGQVSINIFYKPSVKDMSEAVENIRARIQGVRGELPENIDYIEIKQDKVTDTWLMYLSFANFDLTKDEHRHLIRKFKEEVLRVNGVVSIWDTSRQRDIHIRFSPQKLKEYEVSITEARQKIAQHMSYSPIGQVISNEDVFSVEVAKYNEDLKSLRQIPLRSNSTGQVLTLGQVADVNYRLEKQERVDTVNGEPSVLFWLRKGIEADSIDIKGRVIEVIDEFNKKLKETPSEKPLSISIISDGPHFIEQQLSVLQKNGAVGLVLVLLLLIVFLNSRVALMTALGVPIAYFGALIVLSSLGVSIDLISIIGLILVLGMLVDDAIIVSERYSENLEKGLKPQKAALQAASSLLVPVTGTVLTTVVAFAPILVLESEMAVVLFAVPVVIFSALFFSWLESFFILPNHLSHFVKRPPNAKATAYFNRIKSRYEQSLNWSLKWRYGVILFVTLLLGVSGYIGATKIEHNFNLHVSSERVSVYAILKQSDSLAHSQEVIRPVEELLLSFPKDQIENVTTSIGSIWMDGRRRSGYRYIKIRAYLNRNDVYPSKLKAKVLTKVKDKLKELQGSDFEKLYAEGERENSDEDKNAMVSIRVMGSEAVSFDKIEKAIAEKALQQEVITEFVENTDLYQQTWEFQPKAKKLIQYGFNNEQVARQIRGVFVPDKLLQTRFMGERVKVYTSLDHGQDLTVDKLGAFEVHSPIGTSVPLSFLGQWTQKRSLDVIRHRDGQRKLSLDFKFDSKNSNATVAKAQLNHVVDEVKAKFPSYSIYVVDANEQETKSRAWALKVAIVCISLVLLVLALILGSITQPLLVGLPIPTGIIGIIWALYLHGMPMGVMALIGLLGTVGVAVNASLIMVDEINKRAAKKGKMDREVIVSGAAGRLRAIFLTTITTLGGVIPMAYALGGESGFTQPLAFSMGWGLSFATILTLFVLPALLEIRLDFLALLGRLTGKKRVNTEAAENAAIDDNSKDKSELGDWFPSDKPEKPQPSGERTFH